MSMLGKHYININSNNKNVDIQVSIRINKRFRMNVDILATVLVVTARLKFRLAHVYSDGV